MKKQELLDMVLVEANHLREYATKEEKDKLDFYCLDVNGSFSCIYGQMTGDCDSARACTLFNKVFSTIGDYYIDEEGGEVLNKGIFTFIEWDIEKDYNESKIFSPIEVYITLKGSKNRSLIQYIKGEIDTFKP